MSDYSVLAGSLGTPRPKTAVEPILKPVVEKPWTERAGKAAVKARSGGRCELGGPTCLLIAHDVDHVFGRRGPDPHNPDGQVLGKMWAVGAVWLIVRWMRR